MPKTKAEILKDKLNNPNLSKKLKKSVEDKIKVLEGNKIITK